MSKACPAILPPVEHHNVTKVFSCNGPLAGRAAALAACPRERWQRGDSYADVDGWGTTD